MPTRIKITVGELTLTGELNDSPTAAQVLEALPLEASGSTWGDEIYFDIPVNADLGPDAQEAVELGDLAYWPPGTAFCIFYGKTPVSTSTDIRPASPVNVIGKLTDDCEVLKGTPSGVTVRVESI
ncbi:MAG: hypothetical protein GF320_15445 [Armatimonadia bacterium]|nr:hypothetical protein [Armatimonadia bacterium]